MSKAIYAIRLPLLFVSTFFLCSTSAVASEEPSAEAEVMPPPLTAQLIDRIVATVDGEPLTLSDVRRHLATLGQSEKLPAQATREQVQAPLNELIGVTLLTREAEAEGITVADDEIAAYVQEIKRQNGVDDEGFAELLRGQGLTPSQYVEQVRSDILRARVMSARVRSKINILDEDIKKYLEERPDLVPAVGAQRIEQVVIPSALMEENAAKRALEALKQKVEDGLTLREAAKDRYVDLGYVMASELREDLQAVVDASTPGDLSAPIVRATGVYLFRVSAPYAEASDIDETMKEEIRRTLYERRFKEAVTEYVNVELPKKYHVEIKL